MVQNNKILTVSYGTFSCTLEGFDDAFGTMKAIAEYFRDLAAEDRYFGAEPPQPDTEMLAHIAQKEISRRVAAHRDETGIVLRAEDAGALTAASAAAAEAAPAAQPAAPVAQDIAVEDVKPVEPAVSEAAPAEDIAHQVVAEAAEPVEPATDLTDSEASAAAFFAGGSDALAEDEYAEDEHMDDAVLPDTAEPDQTEDAAEPEVVEPVAEETAPANSIAAKLQRIRAVVSSGAALIDDQDDAAGEEPAGTPDAAANVSSLMEQAHDEGDDTAAEPETVLDLTDADALDAHLDALEASTEVPVFDDEDEEDEPVEDIAEDFVAEDADDADDALEDDTLEDDAEDLVAEDDEDTDAEMDEVADEDDSAEQLEPVDEAADDTGDAAPGAKLYKVTREEFDAMLAADRGEAVDDTDEAPAPIMTESSLPQEDEEELLRDLAEVEAELVQDEPAEEEAHETVDYDEDDIDSIFAAAEAEAEDADDDLAEERAILSDDVDGDADTSRLLEEADEKLSDPETDERRSEFAHLRAAVAAGKAEEAAGGTLSLTGGEGKYREDLARVVRPRRPESNEPGERSRRPEDEKPAPLKLVAAQRVDAEAHEPVRPRRVMSRPLEHPIDEVPEGKVKFADYAESVGATELPDLLEAAAAYLSFVEGQEQFSRPQLMTKVRMVEQNEFSREDGLRSFGLLLRDGKIEKTQAGRFTVSDRIGFRPEDMRAAC